MIDKVGNIQLLITAKLILLGFATRKVLPRPKLNLQVYPISIHSHMLARPNHMIFLLPSHPAPLKTLQRESDNIDCYSQQKNHQILLLIHQNGR